MSDAAENDLDLDGRELCPDGACTGVIGADGRCNECGLAANPSVANGNAGASVNAGANGNANANAGDGEADDDIASRRLCSDGSCVGVVGADGCCKVCGLRGE